MKLSYKLCNPLQEYFKEVCHVSDLLSVTTDDLIIWNYSKTNNYHILTKDNDFDEWSLLKGCPPKIIHLLCGNQTTLFILNLIVTNKNIIQNFIENDSNDCILKLHL